MRIQFFIAISLVLASLVLPGLCQDPAPKRAPKNSVLLQKIEQKHPSNYILVASNYFKNGQKEQATFWYYLGQLRYRYYFLANKETMSGTEDASLMSALFETVGRPINEHAFGGLEQLREHIDAAITWDEEHENLFCSKQENAKARQEVLEGLAALRQQTIDRADWIRTSRERNGLENR